MKESIYKYNITQNKESIYNVEPKRKSPYRIQKKEPT